MKAYVYEEYGTPDVLRLRDIPAPVPGDDEVLVRVRASSVNDYDWHLLTGHPFINRIGAPRHPRYPILGCDVAGTVELVGRAVTTLRPGDEVMGDLSLHRLGAFAEFVSAPAAAFSPKPASLTFEQAAALPQAGGLALTALRRRLPLPEGSRVLVNGAGGGVGTFAVQIAKSYGAHVTGVDSAHKADIVRAVGADLVLDYARQDFEDSGLTYDVIVDVACHRPIRTYRRCLRPGGVCSLMGGSIPRVLFAMAAGPAASAIGDRRVSVPMWKPGNPADMATLARLADDGSITPTVDRVVPLADLPDAFRHFGAQQHRGKVVIGF
jgi:NADPH:quinone reductase-like Zn-dependent oxidoreductase